MLTNFRKQEGSEDAKSATSPNPTPGVAPQGTPKLSPAPGTPIRPGIGDGSIVQGADRSSPSVIGPDLVITGNLTSKGQMQIDGEVQGDINGSHVIIGEKARITGGIRAQEVVVRGKVMGSISGNRVMLQANSHVEGDIFHKAIAIEQGAYFEGKSRRSEDPLSDEASANAPAAAPVAISVPG